MGRLAVVFGCLFVAAIGSHAIELTHTNSRELLEAASSANVIPSAGETTLQNGNGDVTLTGACKPDIAAFCKDISAGDGRVVECLSNQIVAAKKGNVAGRTVSDKCAEEVAQFKIERATHINKDVLLARACKDDVAKLCASVSDTQSPGSVIACLRENKNKLGSSCQKGVVHTMQEVAADYRLDVKLAKACAAAVAEKCAGLPTGEGAEFDCLVANMNGLAWDCVDQVNRIRKDSADDFRLSMKLFRACHGDAKKFCKDVEPGHMRVQECLEDSMETDGFSATCKTQLAEVIAARVSDFKLEAGMRETCADDISTLCSITIAQMDSDKALKNSAIKCLQQFKDEIKNSKCKEQVHRKTSLASRDIRFDDVLANACQDDRKSFCPDVQPGSARVIRCLQDHRTNLSKTCAAALFDHETKMAEDIDFKYPMRKACAWEISTFCKDVPHGHARIIRCLQQSLESDDMSTECKEEVMRDMNRAAHDYRLNWRLNHACEADISGLCAGVCNTNSGQPCGGLVLQCLQDKQDNITSSECQEEVFYYELMEVNDFRNDVILAEACRNDVEKYCKDVQPGEGRVHQCLRFHMSYLSDACQREELKLQAVEYRDVRLRPKLNKVCSQERAVYCKDTKPGKARVIKCLMDNVGQANFGEECKAELIKREDVVKNDYRFDVGVATNCAVDVDLNCADAKSKLRGNATVLRCLVDSFDSLTEACQAEMSRAVRFALWDYKPGAGLTAVCDTDITSKCPKGAGRRANGVFTIGMVGRCLSKALVTGTSLSAKCRSLVLAAAPKDARVYLQYPESTSALIAKVAQLQRATGLESVLVDPYARNGTGVTVTGWAALACILSLIAVGVLGAVLLVRRLTGQDKPHTQYVKSGDA